MMYVDFETAKMLKEIGYPQDIFERYSLINYDHNSSTGRWGEELNHYERIYEIGDAFNTQSIPDDYWDSNNRSVARPTIENVIEWFWHNYCININYEINYDTDGEAEWYAGEVSSFIPYIFTPIVEVWSEENAHYYYSEDEYPWPDKEEALNEGIQIAIKQIKK